MPGDDGPDIDVVDGTTLVGHDLEELGQRRLNRTVLNLGAEDTISSYARMIKPLLWAKRLWDFHSRRFIVPYT